MQQPLHRFEVNESTRTPAALRPPVLTDGVVHPSTSPPPPAAVSSITPFPSILFLLEDGFRPSCRAYLLVSHPPSLHPSLKRRRGEQGLQGNIKKVCSIHHHLSEQTYIHQNWKRMWCAAVAYRNHIHHMIFFLVHLPRLYILCMVLRGFSPFLWFELFLMHSAPLPSTGPVWLIQINRDISVCCRLTRACLMPRNHSSMCFVDTKGHICKQHDCC